MILGYLSLGLIIGPAYADEAPAGNAAEALLPKRETDLIDIFSAVSKEYKASNSAARAPEMREELQIRLLRFLRQNPEAKDWVGRISNHGLTAEGDAWISIEIADGVIVSTSKSKAEDAGASTIFHPGSAFFNAAQKAKLGDTIKFSGQFLSSRMADDEDMILRPQLIMLFTDLK